MTHQPHESTATTARMHIRSALLCRIATKISVARAVRAWGRHVTPKRSRPALIRLLGGVFLGIFAALPARAADLTLFDGTAAPTVVYAAEGGAPIKKVADLLAHDLQGLTGKVPDVISDFAQAKGTAVIIGRLDSAPIAALLQANHLDVSAIAGKWETYGRAVVPAPWNRHEQALLIFGSDTRGTIWGVIDLTRELGISPWEWWADAKIRATDHLVVDGSPHYSKEPTVKYRGFFINSGGLTRWAKKTFDPEYGGVGPKTYARVFELMWRLKANVLWPAMSSRERVFNESIDNYNLARDYAVIRGSSHVEMLLRNNSHEWDAKTMGPYNWLENKDRMIAFWRQAIEQWGQYDNLYTVGLRGADDFPMQGARTPEETARVVSEAIAAQRQILSEVLHQPADQIPQLFTPYKEITAAYNTGKIDLPDDIILNWAEDNYGYAMQLSNARERKRSGGSGMYYHLIFWGRPAGYLWVASTDPSLMWEEMIKAYHVDTRAFWILNVGSIKPCEFLMQFFLDMGFDADAFAAPTSVKSYLSSWAGQNFGREHQAEITDILWRYYKLAFDRNPEFMSGSTTFPLTSVQHSDFNLLDYGDENARRADAYRSIMAEAEEVMKALPEDRKAAFFQLVQYTVNIGGNLNLVQLNLDKSITYGLQHRASANVYAEQSRAAYDRLLADTNTYDRIENGKWDGYFTSYVHALPNYQAPYVPTWQGPANEPRAGVQVEGGGYFNDVDWYFPTLPLFHRELGNRSYYLDIFTQQAADADWSVTPNAPWIKVDHTAGRFSAADKSFEQRIQVSIDWAKAPPTGESTVTVKCSAAKQPIDVHVRLAAPVTDEQASFVESQGVVSMSAAHADRRSGAWHVLDGLGHAGANLQADLDLATVDATDAAALAKAPQLEFRFFTLAPDRDYSFPTNIYDETAEIKAVALPSFPITPAGKVRIAVSLDGEPPQVLDFTPEEFSAQWRQNVLRNAAAKSTPARHLEPGSHTLTVYALDPGVTLDRFEIVFTGASPAYGPVPETRIQR